MYEAEPQKLLQFTGQTPVTFTRYEKQVLRCNACGSCFTSSHAPQKWEASARSAILLQKVHGMPFHRLQHLQKLCGTPLAASTAWHQCEVIWLGGGEVVYDALLTLAAQSKLLHVDDTGAKILSVVAENKQGAHKKKGCHTTLLRGKTAIEKPS